MIVFLYHHSSAWVTTTYLTVVRKEQLPLHLEGVPHKVELLGPFLGVVTLVRKQALRSPVFRTTTIIGVGAHPQTSNLHLRVHPSEILMFGSAMDSGVSTLFFGDLLCLCIAFIQLLLQLLGCLVSKLPDSPGSLHTAVVTASSSPLFELETCWSTTLLRARVDWQGYMLVRCAAKVVSLLVATYDECFCLVQLFDLKKICLTL